MVSFDRDPVGTVVDDVADAILLARAEGRCLEAPYGGIPLDAEQAYAVQGRVVAARLARGERVAGWKLGYTSVVMREQMGIAEPNFGPLTDAMLLADGASVPTAARQPKVEPEIALILGRDVPHSVDGVGIRSCVARAHAALEIVDSVWCDYRFGWADNTADGSSAAYVVLGPPLPWDGSDDLADQSVSLMRNGEVTGTGTGSDAMGGPFNALAWLADRLIERGESLRAGDVVITGGLTRAVPLQAGDVVVGQVGGLVVTARGPARV